MSMIENLQGEIWKVIEGYPDYWISSMGRVKSLNYRGNGKEGILKQRKDKNGYLWVGLCRNGEKQKFFSVHRLVATEFIPNPDNLPQVNHLDEYKSNNCVYNLQWVSVRENANHGSRNERIKRALGSSTAFKEALAKLHASQSKQVYQYTTDNILVEVYTSTRSAATVTGFDNGAICQCCNGKRKTHKGYIWSYFPLPNANNQLTLFPLTETKVS